MPGPIGGGEGYERTVDPSEADFTASDRSSLESALASAGGGDIVYVTGDITGLTSGFNVPDGVTLASDRGIGGSPGALIATHPEEKQSEGHGDPAGEFTLFDVGSNVRVTGLRIRGPRDRSEYTRYIGYPSGVGIEAEEPGVEIDNCEVFQFSYAGITLNADEHVHNCHIHTHMHDGVGYGVDIGSGSPLIEWNQFDWNRHSISAAGGLSYEARFNHVGPNTIDHVFDAHDDANDILIHHNTIEATEPIPRSRESTIEAVRLRGIMDNAEIHHNWFFFPEEPPDGGCNGCAVQVFAGSWEEGGVELFDNHYGTDEPSDPNIGAPRDGGGPPPDPSPDPNELRIATIPGTTPGTWYQFTAPGEIRATADTEPVDPATGLGDEVTNNGDGTYTATGTFGPSGVDVWEVVPGQLLSFGAWEIDGIDSSDPEFTEIAVPQGDFLLEWNGQEVTVGQLIEGPNAGGLLQSGTALTVLGAGVGALGGVYGPAQVSRLSASLSRFIK